MDASPPSGGASDIDKDLLVGCGVVVPLPSTYLNAYSTPYLLSVLVRPIQFISSCGPTRLSLIPKLRTFGTTVACHTYFHKLPK